VIIWDSIVWFICRNINGGERGKIRLKNDVTVRLYWSSASLRLRHAGRRYSRCTLSLRRHRLHRCLGGPGRCRAAGARSSPLPSAGGLGPGRRPVSVRQTERPGRRSTAVFYGRHGWPGLLRDKSLVCSRGGRMATTIELDLFFASGKLPSSPPVG